MKYKYKWGGNYKKLEGICKVWLNDKEVLEENNYELLDRL